MIAANDPTRDSARTVFSRALADLGGVDPAVLGSKSATLGRLRAAGFPVPDGFVIVGATAADVQTAAVRDAVTAALDALGGGPVAVRSSATAEDLADASFAGQYESVLEVKGLEAVLDAVETVLRSADSERVERYRESRSGLPAGSGVAVIVQRMVAAESAGVAFTADPVTGDRGRVVVSAVRGLGDRLVSGETNADEWVVENGAATRHRAVENVLDAALALEVAALARRVEVHEGGPQDIEWAAADGQVFLLQARSMTGLPESVSWEPPLPGGWSREFRLGEWLGDPVTPLFESWLLTRIEDRMHRNYGQLLGVPLPHPAHLVVNGWYFYGLNFMPSRPSAMLSMMVRHILPRLIAHPRRTAIAFPPLAKFGVGLAEREWRTQVRPRYRQLVAAGENEVESADPVGLVALVGELADAAGDYFTSATMVAGYASKAQIPLANFYSERIGPQIGGSHLDLLAGLGEAPPTLVPHAVSSLDWWQPTLGESGASPDLAPVTARHADAQRGRLECEATARAALHDPKLLRRFDRLLGEAQRFAVIREDLIAEFTLPWPLLRRAVVRIGGALVEQGVLERPDDVFFMTSDELRSAVGGESTTRSAIAGERRAAWERNRRLVPPLRIGQMPPMIASFIDAAEAAVRGAAITSADDVVGIPASAGRATGPARIVRSLADFERVQPGDVLVAPMTAPAWTQLFDRIAGIVTDTGGVAAHASIVAREYGLPAVVGTANATARLRDGELVEVDGSAGVVRRLAAGG